MEPILIVLFIIVVGVLLLARHLARAQSTLHDWADENEYQVVDSERRTLWRGPFAFNTDEGQEVYRVKVKDHKGKFREGYVRCTPGLLSDKTDVRWDQDSQHRRSADRDHDEEDRRAG